MINLNANVGSLLPNPNLSVPKAGDAAVNKSDFADTIKAIEKHISKVDDLQQSSDVAIKDLLTGKNEDITSVVSAVAKADMSFKLLVGVRNKLIEAYKQTMNMPL
jgi:flagellar hook-basal body complex protein FliE